MIDSMEKESAGLCSACIPNTNGSHTCYGFLDPRCKFREHELAANDHEIDLDANVFVLNDVDFDKITKNLSAPAKPNKALRKLLLSEVDLGT